MFSISPTQGQFYSGSGCGIPGRVTGVEHHSLPQNKFEMLLPSHLERTVVVIRIQWLGISSALTTQHSKIQCVCGIVWYAQCIFKSVLRGNYKDFKQNHSLSEEACQYFFETELWIKVKLRDKEKEGNDHSQRIKGSAQEEC